MPTVLIDLGLADELEICDVSPGIHECSRFTWRDDQGRFLTLSVASEIEWGVDQSEGAWYVEIDAEEDLTISVVCQAAERTSSGEILN